MPDQSEVFLCIMGAPESVHKVKSVFSDENGCFNPYRALAMDDALNLLPTFIRPKPGQTLADYKAEMQSNYLEVLRHNSTRDRFRFHYGIVMNQADFPDSKFIDKEICYFTRTWSPPIEEFISFSSLYKDIAFAMDFDSSWLTHAGSVYISRGDVWYSNYRMPMKDINGYDIGLDINFDFRYKTKHEKLGMLVPPNKLPGIDRIFKRAEPDEMGKYHFSFPHNDFENDHDPKDEYIPNNYVPVLYTPTEEELREFWDDQLAHIVALDRAILFNQIKQ